MLLRLIEKTDSSKYTLAQVHTDISDLDRRQACANVGFFIKKRMMKCDINNIANLKQEHVSLVVYAELQPASQRPLQWKVLLDA